MRQRHVQQFMLRHDGLALEQMRDGVVQSLHFQAGRAAVQWIARGGKVFNDCNSSGVSCTCWRSRTSVRRETFDFLGAALMHRQCQYHCWKACAQLLFHLLHHGHAVASVWKPRSIHRHLRLLNFKPCLAGPNPVTNLLNPPRQFIAINPPCRNGWRHKCRPRLPRLSAWSNVALNTVKCVCNCGSSATARVRERGGDEIAGDTVADCPACEPLRRRFPEFANRKPRHSHEPNQSPFIINRLPAPKPTSARNR